MKLAALTEPDDISVLLIEDSAGDAAAVTKAMMHGESNYNFYVTHKETLADAMHFLDTLMVDAVLLDLNLPDAKETKAIDEVRNRFPDLPIVVISGYSDMDIVHRGLRSGAQEFLIKGECSGLVIRQSIFQAIARKKIERAYQRGERI